MGIHWIICGGESGPGARPFELSWGRDLLRQCRDAGVPVFFKQLGAHARDGLVELHLRDKKGGDLGEFPEWARVREFPEVKMAR